MVGFVRDWRHLVWGLSVAALVLACRPGSAQSADRTTLDALRDFTNQHTSLFRLPPVSPDGSPSEDTGAPAAAPAPNRAALLNAIVAAQQSNIHNKAYPLLAAKWPAPHVVVCWENPSDGTDTQRAVVQGAIAETWEQHSKLTFLFWEQCQDQTEGIRIRISKNPLNGSHVKFLGKYLAYGYDGQQVVRKDGMVLNFDILNYFPDCGNRINECIAVVAIHEFGHAIGFAHEQNRHDTPSECKSAPQGPNGDTPDFTPWDSKSVMNYCRNIYAGSETLSEYDIAAVQKIYGAP